MAETFQYSSYFCTRRVGKTDGCIVHDAAEAGGGLLLLPDSHRSFSRHTNIAQRRSDKWHCHDDSFLSHVTFSTGFLG